MSVIRFRPPRHLPSVSQNAGVAKREGREPAGKVLELAALDWSGRQDLNLRPPGPERVEAESHGVSSGGIASQEPEITGGAGAGRFGWRGRKRMC